jgi:membrane-associated protease RseP (regulator of RpoE activity)
MENKDRTVTVAVITGLVALLLGCCLGTMIGVAGGYWLGHRTIGRPVERFAPENPWAPVLPEAPQLPELPELLGGEGAVIQEVITGSPAEEAGLQVGDIITEVDGIPIDANHRLADVVSQYDPGDRVKVTISRAGDTQRITVTLGENPNDAMRPYLGVRYADFADRLDEAEPND